LSGVTQATTVLQSSAEKAASGRATASICTTTGSLRFEAMVVGHGDAAIFQDHVKWRFLFVSRGR
jgi:hypothetical protein